MLEKVMTADIYITTRASEKKTALRILAAALDVKTKNMKILTLIILTLASSIHAAEYSFYSQIGKSTELNKAFVVVFVEDLELKDNVIRANTHVAVSLGETKSYAETDKENKDIRYAFFIQYLEEQGSSFVNTKVQVTEKGKVIWRASTRNVGHSQSFNKKMQSTQKDE